MSRKTGTNVPKTGTIVHAHPRRHADGSYAAAISSALRDELGKTHRATKTVMNWTGASERTVKHWLSGTRGPSGEHLVALSRHSTVVMAAFLGLCGRKPMLSGRELMEIRTPLIALLAMLESLA